MTIGEHCHFKRAINNILFQALRYTLTITNHIIDEDIDSGHILNYYKLKSKFIDLQLN